MYKMIIFLLITFVNVIYSQSYYVDATDGSDSNDGSSPSSAWKSISKVNNFNFNTNNGNVVVALKRGEVWREELSPSDAGSSENNRIIFTAYGSGRKPVLLGSNSLIGNLSEWVDQGSNVWRRSLSSSPLYIIFEKSGTATNWGYQQSSSSACNSDYKFYYNSGFLYIYSQGNPTQYYSYIENPARAFSIGEITSDYLTFDNLEVWGSFESGIRTSGGDFTRITNCDIHHMGNVRTNNGDGLYIISSNTYIGYNKIWECGSHSSWSGQYGSYIVRNNIWEHNYIVNNYYTGIDLQHINTGGRTGGHIVRFNTIIDSLPQSTYFETGVGVQVLGKRDNFNNVGWSWLTNIEIYGNVIVGHDLGINLGSVCDSIYIYNNTLVNSGFFFFETKTTGGEFSGTWTIPWHGWIKNNIVYRSSGSVMVITTDSNKVFDNNIYYSSSSSPFYAGNTSLSFNQWRNWNLGNHDLSSVYANPQFINQNSGNYLLQSGSPGIDAGVSLGEPYNIDMVGTLRPQGNAWDFGAYEMITGPDITPPEILDAFLINTTTLRVTFSESLDPLSAQNSGNYIIDNNINVVSASLSSSSVTLNTSEHLPGTYNITVNNVTDLSGNVIASPTNSANYFYLPAPDLEPPKLIGTQIVDANQLVLDFSEPLSSDNIGNLANYSISNQIEVTEAFLAESGTRIFLTTANHDTNVVYNFVINNLEDLAGNLISQTNNSSFYKLISIPTEGWREYLIENVEASATTDTSTSPNKTLDGLFSGDPDPNSRWAAQYMPHWIQYDIGSQDVIKLIAISFYRWDSGRIYQYSIQVSSDLTEWTEIVSNSSSVNQEWTINEFNGVNARYIRIICLNNNEGDWAGIWEARVLGEGSLTSVELESFKAEINEGGSVILSWSVLSGSNGQIFEIERKQSNTEFALIGNINGNVIASVPNQYSFTDISVSKGVYTYRIKQIDSNGNYEYSNEIQIEVIGPLTFNLAQNYPNPFNPKTTIEFSVPKLSFVSLKVFDILGSEVAALVNEEKTAGNYKINFDAKNLPSGTYFARIIAGDYSEIKKMILLK